MGEQKRKIDVLLMEQDEPGSYRYLAQLRINGKVVADASAEQLNDVLMSLSHYSADNIANLEREVDGLRGRVARAYWRGHDDGRIFAQRVHGGAITDEEIVRGNRTIDTILAAEKIGDNERD